MARISSLRLLALLSTLALGACSGTGAGLGGILGGSGFQCDPGTQVQLARPSPSQFGVSPSIGQVEIVANGNSNTLGNTYSQWNLVLQDNAFDAPITTGTLNLVPDPSGPHPYSSDFFYSANIGTTLRTGVTYTVTMEQQPFGSCSPFGVGSFST